MTAAQLTGHWDAEADVLLAQAAVVRSLSLHEQLRQCATQLRLVTGNGADG